MTDQQNKPLYDRERFLADLEVHFKPIERCKLHPHGQVFKDTTWRDFAALRKASAYGPRITLEDGCLRQQVDWVKYRAYLSTCEDPRLTGHYGKPQYCGWQPINFLVRYNRFGNDHCFFLDDEHSAAHLQRAIDDDVIALKDGKLTLEQLGKDED